MDNVKAVSRNNEKIDDSSRSSSVNGRTITPASNKIATKQCASIDRSKSLSGRYSVDRADDIKLKIKNAIQADIDELTIKPSDMEAPWASFAVKNSGIREMLEDCKKSDYFIQSVIDYMSTNKVPAEVAIQKVPMVAKAPVIKRK